MCKAIKLDYTNILNKRFLENKDKLIESFIEYYGEKHRDRIKVIYDNTIIVYYVGQNITDLINTYNLFEFELNLQQKEMYEMEKKLASDILTDEEKNKIRYVGSNKTDEFTNEELSVIINTVVNTTKSNTPKKMLWIFEGKIHRFIFLPSYIWTDFSIIHEMNHQMTSDGLLLIESEDDNNSHISISGLNIDGYNSSDEERVIEELINEMSTMEITKIFHAKGGTYVEENIKGDISEESNYRKNFYLVEKFYTYFKDVIKEARISENKNLLLQTCGKGNYYKLVNLVNQYYNTGFTTKKAKEIDRVFESMVCYYHNISEL